MDIQTILLKIGKSYQDSLEKNTVNFPTGSCYLSAHCLNAYFSKISIPSSLVVGDLALINIKDKYAVYGSMKLLKYQIVGNYHAWCEVEFEDKTYIIDPSIKYNKIALKNNFNFKISKKIGDIIISDEKIGYNWKYKRNDKLIPQYKAFINIVSIQFIGKITDELIKNYPILDVKN